MEKHKKYLHSDAVISALTVNEKRNKFHIADSETFTNYMASFLTPQF